MYAVTKMKGIGSVLGIVLCALFAVLCVAFPATSAGGLRDGLDLCYRAIIPSMLPFLFAGRYLFSRLARHPGRAYGIVCCLFFSFVGGFPMGARSLRSLVENGTLTTAQASLLLAGAVNAGPAFLITSVGGAMFGSITVGLLLFVSLTAGSLFCLVLLASVQGPVLFENEPRQNKAPILSPPVGVTRALEEAVTATLSMCGYVSVFSCVLALIHRLFPLSPVPRFCAAAVCEVSNGCREAVAVGGKPGLYLACAAVSLCGVSVLLQLRSALQGSGISMKPFFLLRPLHCAFSLIVLRTLLSGEAVAETFAAASAVAARLFSINPAFSLFFLLTGLVLILSGKRFCMARPVR